MNFDAMLTGAVIMVALIYVIRKFMKPGCSGCGKNSCGCESSDGKCPPLVDLRDKENKESQK